MSETPSFTIVVACDKNRGIGKDNDLPWDLPNDLKFFSKITRTTIDPLKQNAVIMGRKTWESIPDAHRPLKGRLNIVISRQTKYKLPKGTILVHSLKEALQVATEHKVETIHNIGGAQIFNLGLKHPGCKTLYITELDQEFDCDTHLPAIPEAFKKAEESDIQEENNIRYRFVRYEHQ